MQGMFFSRLFEFSYGALFRNLEGITHEESLMQPQPAGNSLNWVLGHIVANRNRLLALLGVPPIWPVEQAYLYSGREEARWSSATALPLDTLKTDLARSQQQLMAVLDATPSATLDATTEGGQPLREVVGFFHFHESYHGGQVALLRRLVGRHGVITGPGSVRRLAGAQPQQ